MMQWDESIPSQTQCEHWASSPQGEPWNGIFRFVPFSVSFFVSNSLS